MDKNMIVEFSTAGSSVSSVRSSSVHLDPRSPLGLVAAFLIVARCMTIDNIPYYL